MTAMFLLGAGASAEAGVPLATQLTALLTERVNDDTDDTFGRRFGSIVRALNFVLAALLAHDARNGANPMVLPDIERVVSAVSLLSSRDDLEVAPFILNWDQSVDALELRATPPPAFIGRKLASAILRTRNGKPDPDIGGIERVIKSAVSSVTSQRRDDVFGELHKELVYKLVRELELDPQLVDYLQPLVRSSHHPAPPDIATLNYDLSVETAAAAAGIACSTGVDHWAETGLLEWPDSGVRLMKLHGSVDWGLDDNGRFTTDVPARANRSAALIFGQREKLRAPGPFLQLLETFRSSLYRHSALVVIGYSFRDSHVNELLHQWMTTGAARRIVLVDPYATLTPKFPPQGHLEFFGRYALRGQSPRIVLVNESTSTFVARLGAGAAMSVVEELFVAAQADQPRG